jgi:integrase
MSRRRNEENRKLPQRWIFSHNAFYYQVPRGLESEWGGKRMFRLGKTLTEAYHLWAERVEGPEQIKTIGQLLDEYSIKVIPTKAPSSQECQRSYIRRLKNVFGTKAIEDLKPKDVYAFSRACRDSKKTMGRGEIEVLRHAYTKAVEWGYVERNPLIGQLRLPKAAPRDRYIEDWEVAEMFGLDSKRKKGSVRMIHAYLRLKMMTGMSRGDLLRITKSNLTDDGILIQRHKTQKKTGKRTIYSWTPELRAAVEQCVEARPCLSPFLFCDRNGKGYVNEETGLCCGFDSVWGRFVDRVLKETKVTRRFTEHDFRAKTASDADTADHARALLSHADVNTTNRVYRRKPETVIPLKSVV